MIIPTVTNVSSPKTIFILAMARERGERRETETEMTRNLMETDP